MKPVYSEKGVFVKVYTKKLYKSAYTLAPYNNEYILLQPFHPIVLATSAHL